MKSIYPITKITKFTSAYLVLNLASYDTKAFAFAPHPLNEVRHVARTKDMMTLMARKRALPSKPIPIIAELNSRHTNPLQETVNADTHRNNGVPTSSSLSKSPPTNDVWIARLLLLLSAALYGTNFTMVKSLDESLSVGISSTLRFGFAALCMLPWLLTPIDEELKTMAKDKLAKCKNEAERRSCVEPTSLAAGLAGMEIGMYNSIGYITQAVGLKTIPANKSAFICSMAVVTVPILDFLFGKELLKRQVLGAGLAAMGVWALEMGGQDTSPLGSGDILSLAQPIMFGLGFWRMEAAMEKYPTESGRLAAAQLLMVFLVSLSYLICGAPFTDSCEVMPSLAELGAWLHDPHILGMLFWTGIITTAFTIWMETLALRTLSAAETTLIFSTEPLFGAAFASVVANECFGREGAIGAAFIIGGCLVSGIDLDPMFIKLPSKWKANSLSFQNKDSR